MTSQTGKARFDWRRAIIGGVSSGAIAVALMRGFGVSTAFAQPADPAGRTAAAPATIAPRERRSGRGTAAATTVRRDDADARRARTTDAPKTGNADRRWPPSRRGDHQQRVRPGDGGGQISTLIDDVMKLRAQGFQPVECEQAGNRGRAGAPAQPDAAGGGAEGNAAVSAQTAGAGRRCPTQQAGPVAGPGRYVAGASHQRPVVRRRAASTSRSADAPSCSTKNF